jgi:chromosome partitioning protein
VYDPRSRGAEAYFELAREFLARNGMESPRGLERKAQEAKLAERPAHVRFWPYS